MSKKKSSAKTKTSASKERGKVAPANKTKPATRANSKQGAVLSMLSQPKGSTIAAIMMATGWQQHSVRGFFAGVVRKKFKLTLESEKTDGERWYRIISDKGAKPATSDAEQRAA